jgi:hypothetical protein
MEVKLIIEAFESRERSGTAASSVQLKLNPQSITKRHEHQYAKYRGINSSRNTATYGYSLAEEISFQFSVVESSALDYGAEALGALPKSVDDQIKEFMDVCYWMNGKIHEPNFLKISWNKIKFKCKLKSLDIKYTSFARNGDPRKAELDVVFIEDLASGAAIRGESKSSPDLTHVVTVKEGDTLSLLTEKVYGITYRNLYLEVAKVNKLNNFRDLRVGQQLIFPPLDK